MRSTWLPLGFALVLPATSLLGACGPGVETTTSTGGGTAGSTTNGGGGVGGTTTDGGGGVGGGTTTVGGGGTGGTGGAPTPANDVCPGEKVSLAIGASMVFTGTLKGAADDYTTFCADTSPEPDASDVVYQLDVPAAATVTLKLEAIGFNPAMSLRLQDCSQRLGFDACLNFNPESEDAKVALEAGTYWVVIDSADGQVGDFKLSVTYAAPVCGDGVVNAGEQCDPAMPSGFDGCVNPGMADGCQNGEAPPDPAIIKCPGGLITIAKDDAFQLGPYNNGTGESTHVGTCAPAGTPSGPEDVFHVVPKADGMLTAQIGYDEDGVSLYCNDMAHVCGDFFMYMRKGSCTSVNAADEMACTDNTPNDIPPYFYDELLTIAVPVTKDTDYWLFVDGLDETYGIGPYFLKLSLK